MKIRLGLFNDGSRSPDDAYAHTARHHFDGKDLRTGISQGTRHFLLRAALHQEEDATASAGSANFGSACPAPPPNAD